jgi:dTMP kinase
VARRGRFIVFEGGEACGKSTQSALLANALGADLSREPGGTELGERVRALLLGEGTAPLAPRTELLLVAAQRAQHVHERIAPMLESGRDVVCDRFSGSTLAYQGYGRGLPLEDVLVANELATAGLAPDLVVLLDLDPELAMRRFAGRPDRIEAAGGEFHRRVVDGFRLIAAADPEHWVRLDASGSVEEVAAAVRRVVAERLDLGGGSHHDG